MADSIKKNVAENTLVDTDDRDVCGVIMPISSIDGCSESHWLEVKDILYDAVHMAGMQPRIVSDDMDSGVIHKRIVQNLYENSVVVCDISGRNPNVMLELGMRLAFDKPVLVVKDDVTPYSFDTSPVQHLNYPRDLRFKSIVEFKDQVAEKVTRLKESSNDNSFLKSFGPFVSAKIESKVGTGQDIILDEILGLKSWLRRTIDTPSERLRSPSLKSRLEVRLHLFGEGGIGLCLRGNSSQILRFRDMLFRERLDITKEETLRPDHMHLTAIPIDPTVDTEAVIRAVAIELDASITYSRDRWKRE